MSVATSTPDDDDGRDRAGGLPGFEILETIDDNHRHVLYRARQRSLNRIVAIRTSSDTGPEASKWSPRGNPDATRELLCEARVLARLQHPHVAAILDKLEHEGRVYLVLEHFEGTDLATRIGREKQAPAAAAALAERLARTLAYIHNCGIVHCNLNPKVVLLTDAPAGGTPGSSDGSDWDMYGLPVITDFGAAVDLRNDPDTRFDPRPVTLAYMAPEQAYESRAVTPATDIYSLGSILYEMLTGRLPFAGETAYEYIVELTQKTPEPVRKLNPDVDQKLAALCEKCLEKEPARRYASGLELAHELRAFAGGLAKKRRIS
jgi:serine/threonine-protein kinase